MLTMVNANMLTLGLYNIYNLSLKEHSVVVEKKTKLTISTFYYDVNQVMQTSFP